MSLDRAEQQRRGQVSRKTHPFIALEHRVFDSPAFADLKHSSVRVLLAVARQLTKDNNGHLQCSFAWCKRHGIGSDNTLADAIADLIVHGLPRMSFRVSGQFCCSCAIPPGGDKVGCKILLLFAQRNLTLAHRSPALACPILQKKAL